jgi:acyl-CoA reductase-like NAD-dependent aldehyde dehydrogenase
MARPRQGRAARCRFELGGKNAGMVFADADFDKADEPA